MCGLWLIQKRGLMEIMNLSIKIIQGYFFHILRDTFDRPFESIWLQEGLPVNQNQPSRKVSTWLQLRLRREAALRHEALEAVENLQLGPPRGRMQVEETPIFWCTPAWFLGGETSNIFYFQPQIWGKWSNLTNIFQRGWFNHQLGLFFLRALSRFGCFIRDSWRLV